MEELMIGSGSRVIFTHGGMSDVQIATRTPDFTSVLPLSIQETKDFIEKLQKTVDRVEKNIQNEEELKRAGSSSVSVAKTTKKKHCGNCKSGNKSKCGSKK